MSKVIILGCGAAPGVPSLSYGFGDCDPNNPKNIRLRSGTYLEIGNTKFLIDTSTDLRMQLILSNIRDLDAVFYTHPHADQLHGIDDLREVNRIQNKSIELFASDFCLDYIKARFSYLLVENDDEIDPVHKAALHPNRYIYEESFYFKDVKITPIKLSGHNLESSGYIFNDGEVVYISDCRDIPDSALKLITKQPEVLIMPLTTPNGTKHHMGLDDLLKYVKKINPKRTLINHMATESDYENVKSRCFNGVEPAYDGLEITWNNE